MLIPFSDEQLLASCVYCGAETESKDHVPSRVLLDRWPEPTVLPTVPACKRCNNGFSDDERYLACLIDCVVTGSTDPALLRRPKVARTLEARPVLRAEIEATREQVGDRIVFAVENDRVENVLLKLTKGHAAFELSEPQLGEPESLRFGPLETMTPEERTSFEQPQASSVWPEVGSRAMQRIVLPWRPDVSQWVTVQPGRYRYAAFLDPGVVVRVVLSEYLAGEASWP